MTKRMMRVLTPSPHLVTPGGIALSDSEKIDTLVDSREANIQLVTAPPILAVIEMVDVAQRSYFMTPASVPKWTDPDEVQEAIRDL
jgi:hypothetical protein